jgi:DNA-3-methyladenine glycosylase II
MKRLESPADLAAAVDRLISVEPRFAKVLSRHGLPPLRHATPGLETLLRIVTDQLISLKAGEAIWKRLAASLSPFDPKAVLACPEADLRALGLSGAKARTFHAAALAFAPGLAHSSDEELFKALTAIAGVGPWTANIYLLTAARSADAWPAADLALQQAAMDLLSLPARPAARDMEQLAEGWRPYRGAAALLLWSHYRGLKRLPQG